MSALDIFQTIGSIVALCTGAFTIFDRFFRYQPTIGLTAKMQGVNAMPMLRVRNGAPFDIYIESIIIEPPAFGIAAGTSVRAIADILMFKNASAIVEPGGERLFHLVKFDIEARGISEVQIIKVEVPWRRSESSWIRPKPAVLKTTMNDISDREKAAIRAGQ